MSSTTGSIFAALCATVILAGCKSGEDKQIAAAAPSPAAAATASAAAAAPDHKAVNVKGKVFSPDAMLDKLNKNKQFFATGWDPSAGIWIITVQQVRMDNGMSEAEAIDIAAMRARHEIAAFLGSSVSSQEKKIVTEKTVDGKSATEEFFKSVTRINVKQFLRGTVIFRQEVKDGSLYAAFYVTGRIVDSSAELEQQLQAVPPGTVQAVGFVIIANGEIASARQKAIQIALRSAVEQVLGTSVIAQSKLMDNDKARSRVISQTAGNIRQYRILKEMQAGINYQVILNAEVDEKSLLDNYASIVRSMGNPSFFVNTADPDLYTAFSGFLSDLGFNVTAEQSGAQFIFDADCKYLEVEDPNYGKGIQIDLALRLFSTSDKRQLFSIGNTPRLTSTYSGTFHQIRGSAAKKAFRQMKNQLHEKLNKVVMDWVLNGHDVKVTFHGIPADASLAKTLEDAVSSVPCAQIHARTQTGADLSFTCSYVGPTTDFEYFLQERLRKCLPSGMSQPKTSKVQLSDLEFNF